MEGEIWKTILGHSDYTISSFGRVKNNRLNKYIYPHDNDGYKQIPLSTKKVRHIKRVHRLVAEAFIPNPENKPMVNHKDNVRSNNHVDNLEWATAKQNSVHFHNQNLNKRKLPGLVVKDCMLATVNKLIPFM